MTGEIHAPISKEAGPGAPKYSAESFYLRIRKAETSGPVYGLVAVLHAD